MPTTSGKRTSTRPARNRAERTLVAQRLQAPATHANTARNARAALDRHRRWAPARDALWRLLDTRLTAGARVAIVGAGNGDTMPLDRIVDHAGEVALIDLDGRAIRAARRNVPRGRRRRITVIEHDITHGAADAIAVAAANREVPEPPVFPEAPLPGAPYDLVIGDLFYSQLLYPALVDLDVPATRTTAFLDRYAPALTRMVVARLHVSAPNRSVLHIHDPIAWWPGHAQPVTLDLILATAQQDPAAALTLAARGTGPHHSDPRSALRALSIPIEGTVLWGWPFAPRVDYLACATLARSARVPGAPPG
jgi:Protein-L-isoaspartate(D-aspartate) O-methyltransferase (PCMT)